MKSVDPSEVAKEIASQIWTLCIDTDVTYNEKWHDDTTRVIKSFLREFAAQVRDEQVREDARIAHERGALLERESKQLNDDGKREYFHRILEAAKIEQAILAQATRKTPAKEATDGT